MRLATRLLLVLMTLLLATALSALGQEVESVRFGVVRVAASTVLRSRPNAAEVALLPLAPGLKLRWVEGQQRNGFVRVITEGGKQGWIPAAAVVIESQPSVLFAASPPCAATLELCPDTGCSQPNSKHALFDQTKRHIPTQSTPVTLTFPDLEALQEQASNLVNQGLELSAADRAKLSNLHVSSGTVREGSLVKVIGFIAQGSDPHANSGESVNCRRTGVANNDFHISFAPRTGNDEFDGIVVEMIPQNRPANWSLPRLKSLKNSHRLLMVVGAIFYDNAHVVNADRENPLQGQPRRFSLWEIHPITQFRFCKKANNQCNPNNAGDWKALEDQE